MSVRRLRAGDAVVAFADAAGSSGDASGLSETDQRRAAALVGIRRARFLVGRSLIRSLIGELAPGSDAAVIARCPRCGGDHGPVRAVGAPVSISVSYAGSVVAVAATRGPRAVGIDIERGEPRALVEGLERVFRTPPTRRRWTEFEAVVKADGRGLAVPPDAVRFEPRGESALAHLADARYRVDALDAPTGYTASIAVD
ncbi:MAG: 4'-phosphopantetheinyl transferase family protein [Microbacterium gubbeenense]|uniref:4'-phosphopantetheinyl transferase family protein n=1 Tax=Microbacterium gubbeenense TaxID=159896 RepID=UPI0004116F10|nr:hypothetical protein [Microbacterium gubbeenense]